MKNLILGSTNLTDKPRFMQGDKLLQLSGIFREICLLDLPGARRGVRPH